MQEWIDQGKTPQGLRVWAEAILNRPELRCGYCECVLKSAADEMERLQNKLKGVEQLIEIVEGVRNERWAANGVRLKDTPEWCALYVAAKKE